MTTEDQHFRSPCKDFRYMPSMRGIAACGGDGVGSCCTRRRNIATVNARKQVRTHCSARLGPVATAVVVVGGGGKTMLLFYNVLLGGGSGGGPQSLLYYYDTRSRFPIPRSATIVLSSHRRSIVRNHGRGTHHAATRWQIAIFAGTADGP